MTERGKKKRKLKTKPRLSAWVIIPEGDSHGNRTGVLVVRMGVENRSRYLLQGVHSQKALIVPFRILSGK